MVHPSENLSTSLCFLAQSQHVGGHDMQQHDKPSAADGASAVAARTPQQITLLAVAGAAVVGAAAANELVAVVAATPCVVGFVDSHDLFLGLLMWPQGAAAVLVPCPL
jgi:hypothetical protein